MLVIVMAMGIITTVVAAAVAVANQVNNLLIGNIPT